MLIYMKDTKCPQFSYYFINISVGVALNPDASKILRGFPMSGRVKQPLSRGRPHLFLIEMYVHKVTSNQLAHALIISALI